MKVGLQIMGNILTPLAKSALMPSGLTAATSAEADAVTLKKNYQLRNRNIYRFKLKEQLIL